MNQSRVQVEDQNSCKLIFSPVLIVFFTVVELVHQKENNIGHMCGKGTCSMTTFLCLIQSL